MTTDTPSTKTEPIRLTALARIALYIGATAYGGPSIIAHTREVIVRRLGWVSDEDFLAGLSLAQMLPGATATNLLSYLGYRLRGARGMVVTTVAFLAPCFVLMLALSVLYMRYGALPIANALLLGLGAAVVGLLINAVVTLARPALTAPWSVGVALVACAVSWLFHPHVLLIAAGAGLVGWLVWKVQSPKSKAQSPESPPPTPDTQHPRPVMRFLVPFTAFVLIVAALYIWRTTPAVALVLAFLRVGTFAFGGGFAALPVIEHEALHVHQWLTPQQFLDGIALGQITPGPVLITAEFIGYRVLGIPGALLATVAVFLPGWAGMLLLAHQHGRVAHLPDLQAVVREMLAGFIGVLAAIALTLAQQSITDLRTWAIACISTAVLLLWKRDPVWVILGAAVVSPLLFRG